MVGSDATDEEVIDAAKAAHADHFVRTLPDGYDMVLDEEASNVSQGQKQLLTIARAFLADPKILILDEATSSVDTRTEVLIQKAMDIADAEPHQLYHRPPAVHHPQCRPDPGDEQRRHCGAGHATWTCWRAAASMPSCTTASLKTRRWSSRPCRRSRKRPNPPGHPFPASCAGICDRRGKGGEKPANAMVRPRSARPHHCVGGKITQASMELVSMGWRSSTPASAQFVGGGEGFWSGVGVVCAQPGPHLRAASGRGIKRARQTWAAAVPAG